ncbi:hypothetical protein NVS47_17150 [Dehalobacterium formicoaceticum]|jgi:hypothetical protein|uniref:Uncharacterized protein n=1 Tax=Dehalobacterium formicoaceticum TaxID=51515 RepID=A0ABT1Y9R0_9FIRM|nr:hypothetical protein [Dehalobacterium formicoaceticum]MCR6547216.1 hypothetical protein [Dehalobacterium formicoaceticum]
MTNFIDVLTKDITINVLIGFFYSALLGLLVFILTDINGKRNNIRRMEIDLTKYTFVSQSINNSLTNISQIDGADYRRFFGDILDGKQIQMSDYKNVYEFIIFDKIPELPALGDYLVSKFIDKMENSIEENKIEELLDLLKQTNKEKENYINKRNLFLIRYEDINRRIKRLNERLDYYRFLSKQLIAFENPNKNNESQIVRHLHVFRYCTDSIIQEAKTILKTLQLLDDAIMSKKRDIKQEINQIDKNYNIVFKILVGCLIVCGILLLVA